ncbi:hypothetical protein KSP39_PZI021729 [Platanthera zijinensis]|uniref:Uncharacterized protein n=1 Tax=Platanthera zijinensis TaxID=2320716 RepID=A0AAP0AZD5_9ASPA
MNIETSKEDVDVVLDLLETQRKLQISIFTIGIRYQNKLMENFLAFVRQTLNGCFSLVVESLKYCCDGLGRHWMDGRHMRNRCKSGILNGKEEVAVRCVAAKMVHGNVRLAGIVEIVLRLNQRSLLACLCRCWILQISLALDKKAQRSA